MRSSDASLTDAYDVAMLDLDGVVYVSGHAVKGAPDAIADVRDAGMRVAFVTNNASRTPDQVTRNLVRLGVPTDPAEVVTSAQAAARLLRDRFGAGARILALGGRGLITALAAEDLQAVAPEDAGDAADLDALATGYGPDVLWRHIMRAAVLVRDGLPWVASNSDASIPTDFGVAPGHGVLVKMLADFTGVDPIVAGKPEPPLLEETIRRCEAQRPIMVGDRLDTDIAGAHRVGVDSLLVLTGVTGLAELVAAPPEQRPTYLSPGLEGLTATHPGVETADGLTRVGGWTAHVTDGSLGVEGEGTDADWWRAAAVAAWAHLDRTGDPAGLDNAKPPADPGEDG